eukprot:CAMPEP_0172529232 /NCGR_PEP_ID=MMETSP1067-20121228/3368_1 /TAXON_ID=265564 ORGANISM="Thalassiosira punctigera, Strain Tpunct2005C2" /NCGR_SAMPLE_ID=MMETSP1067 /ASSEMBLY_ACC=CAM_ASM_000444 /LENGTH=261 /DNA_ID=CAMNT_0013313251 /DNA_START=80 /DNA_END=865 /DNA_ORIENTATION=+
MTLIRIPIVVVWTAVLASQAFSFSPAAPCDIRATSIVSTTELSSLIQGEEKGAESLNENEGGVGLAKRTAVKISGVSQKGKGSEARELLRYDRMQGLDGAVVESVMEKAECALVCSGTGKELYRDPGSSNRVEDKVIALAPIEAAKDALASMASAFTIGEDNPKSVVVNFLGGDELIIGEVLEACDLLVEELDFPAKTKVKFHSISFDEIPADVCSVTVVASGGKAAGMEGVDQSVAKGELYARDGKWFTVAEGDITTASN